MGKIYLKIDILKGKRLLNLKMLEMWVQCVPWLCRPRPRSTLRRPPRGSGAEADEPPLHPDEPPLHPDEPPLPQQLELLNLI